MNTLKILLGYLLISILFIQYAKAEPIWTGAFRVASPIFITTDKKRIFVTNDYINLFNPSHHYEGQLCVIGGENRQFNKPRKIAIDQNTGITYVVDNNNNRIQYFSNNDLHLEELGSKGSGVKEFNSPTSMLITDQAFYITDYGNNRIQVLHKDHTIASEFGSSGDGEGEFYQPWDIAEGPGRKIYVTDFANNRFQIFDQNGHFLNSVGSRGSEDGQFKNIHGITVDLNGKVYVVDYGNHRIQIFDQDGNYLNKFGLKGSGKGQFRNPFGITITTTGKLYVADYSNDRIAVLFEPSAWKEPGTVYLGNLELDQDLILQADYHLQIQKTDNESDTIEDQTLSDGKLTIKSGANLTSNPGSSVIAEEIILDGGKFTANQNMDLKIPISFAGNNNYFNVAAGKSLAIDELVSPSNSKLIKIGEGELIVGPNAKHQGITAIKAGSIYLDAAKLWQVTVGKSGMLRGRGYVNGDLINYGIVSPGSPLGTLIVEGNYHQVARSSLEIHITPAEHPQPGVNNSLLSVNGAAYIDDSTIMVRAEAGNYTENARYNFLEAQDGINGVFAQNMIEVLGPYTASLIYEAKKVSVSLSRTTLSELINDRENTSRHIVNDDLANYIDSFGDDLGPELSKIIGDLHNMNSDSDLDQALESITPNRNLVSAYISQDVSSWIHNINNTRMEIGSYINNDRYNFNFSNVNNVEGLKLLRNAKSGLMDNISNVLEFNLLDSDQQQIWAAPFGYFIKQESSKDQAGYDAKAGGMVVGYDKRYSDKQTGGLSLGYYHSLLNHQNAAGSNNMVHGVFASIYGKKILEQGYLKGSIYVAYNYNKLHRNIKIGNDQYSAYSSHISYNVSPYLEFGYNYMTLNKDYSLTPFFSSEYSMVFANSYQEKGADMLNMHISSGRNDVWINELGVKLATKLIVSCDDELIIRGKLSYINKNRIRKYNGIRARFYGIDEDYRSNNNSKVRHAISPSLAFELRKQNGMIIGFGYSAEFSRKYQMHEGLIKVGIQF